METKSSKIFFTISAIILVCLLTHVTSKASLASTLCNGSVAECSSVVETEEITVMMESWSSQRFMADQPNTISYDALTKNHPACSNGNRGASYSERCVPSKANDYKKGCSMTYRCKRPPP